MNTLVVSPMYRDYKSQKEAVEAWKSNKDFRIENINDRWGGKPCNMSDVKRYSPHYTHVEIRFNKLRDYALITL